MTILQYKGYQGAVEFDRGRLVVRILHIDDFVSDECDAASDAQNLFEDLVEDYVATCKELGREPSKAYKGTFNVRIEPDVHRRAAMSATGEGQTLNAWVASAIQEKLRKSSEDPAAFRHTERNLHILVDFVSHLGNSENDFDLKISRQEELTSTVPAILREATRH